MKWSRLIVILALGIGSPLLVAENLPVQVQINLGSSWALANHKSTATTQVLEYIPAEQSLDKHDEIISYIRLQQGGNLHLEKVYNETIANFQKRNCTIQQSGARTDEALLSMYLLYDCPKMNVVGMNQFIDGRDGHIHTVSYEIKQSPLTQERQAKLQSLFLRNLQICQGPCQSAAVPTEKN